MSIETDFRQALAGFAGLSALVGTRISKNAVDQDAALPIVVFSASHEPQLGLDGSAQLERVDFAVECWAETALGASAVADQVALALDAYNASQTTNIATVLSRAAAYDGDLKLDGESLAVEWWRT